MFCGVVLRCVVIFCGLLYISVCFGLMWCFSVCCGVLRCWRHLKECVIGMMSFFVTEISIPCDNQYLNGITIHFKAPWRAAKTSS